MPLSGPQVRAPHSMLVGRPGQATLPASLAPENTQQLYSLTQPHKQSRTLPVRGDTYPGIFLLLFFSAESFIDSEIPPSHTHTHIQQKCLWKNFHTSCQCPLLQPVSGTQFISAAGLGLIPPLLHSFPSSAILNC